MKRINAYLAYLKDERGIETLEWILIGGLITVVAVAVYNGVLQGQLTDAITTIGERITGGS